MMLASSFRFGRRGVHAKVTYPIRPAEGRINGRLIDEEHWSKVASIFPNEKWDSSQTLLLDDGYEERDILIEDARLTEPRLEKEGFALVRAPTVVNDMFKEKEQFLNRVRKTLENTFKKTKTIVPFHWLVRDSRRDNLDSSRGPASFNGQAHAPVQRVHGDYTIQNAPLRFQELQAKGTLPADWNHETEHWAIVNLWQNLGLEPIRSKPLALLDASSIQYDRVFEYVLVSRSNNNVGRNYSIDYDPMHRWFFFPSMTPDEAILFFTYEHATTIEKNSTVGAKERYVFHSAFDLPPSLSIPPPRISIEVRSLVVFDSADSTYTT